MTDEENIEQVLQKEILLLERLKRRKADIEAEIEDIQKYLDKTLDKPLEVTDEETGETIRATVVRGTVDKFDDHLMSTRYKRIYSLVTKRVIDKGLYLDAVRAGTITPEMNARFHHEIPRKSFVKVTRYFKGSAIEASE